MNYNYFKNKKILVIGHTGFKGSWLSLILSSLNAKIYGISLKPEKNSLFETILISANDELVSLYLKKLICFNDIQKRLFQIINLREFKAYKNKKPKNIGEINKLNAYVRLKIKRLCI